MASWDRRKIPFKCSNTQNPQYYLKHRVKTTGPLRCVEPWFYTYDCSSCQSRHRQRVSSSLDQRDWGDFPAVSAPQGITMAKATLFFGIKQPLHISVFSVLFFSLCSRGGSSSAHIALPSLSAGAGLDGHIVVNLEYGVFWFVLVKHSQGTHLLRDTAGLRNARDDPHGSDYALNSCVIRGPWHLEATEWGRGGCKIENIVNKHS